MKAPAPTSARRRPRPRQPHRLVGLKIHDQIGAVRQGGENVPGEPFIELDEGGDLRPVHGAAGVVPLRLGALNRVR